MAEADNTPSYGSQEYWEQRYKHGETKNGRTGSSDEAYHSWYYTYKELKPLIMPLILGGAPTSPDEDEDKDRETTIDKSADETFTSLVPIRESQEGDKAEDNEKPSIGDSSSDDGVLEVVEEGSDDESYSFDRVGLAADGPIEIMEIGCGDVPLGADLALDLLDLELTTGSSALSIVNAIYCNDYSPAVIDHMREMYRTSTSSSDRRKRIKLSDNKRSVDLKHIPLRFEVADARSLPNENDSIDLVLEKGTLDAMLSDKADGTKNCVAIVAECARVVKENGYIVIVSHFNAHTSRGIGWTEDVLVPGLTTSGKADWEVEVHGNDCPEDGVEENAGPAVYIVHQLGASGESSVQFRFYSY